MRKAQQSNRTFMLGTLVLGILVIGIVILFTALAYDLNFTQEEQQAQVQKGKAKHHFHLKRGFYPAGCDVYLNDILLFANTARAMGDAELFIKCRHIRNCYRADPRYGEGVAREMNIKIEDALKE